MSLSIVTASTRNDNNLFMMAKEGDLKKRKASIPESGIEKTKKVKKVSAEIAAASEKKRKATEEAAPVAVKKSKTPKSKIENGSTSMPEKAESGKPARRTNGDTAKEVKSATKKLKPVRAPKERDIVQSPSDVEGENEVELLDEEEDSEVDDQTEALLKGFESDGDEEDAENEGGLKEGEKIPAVPDLSKQSKRQLQKALESKKDDEPGVVYVGRIPHGFFEHEMRDYFSQFGTITKLRLSRNPRSGRSKHVAWIEFESSAVAEIVAKTMDNYLLFNHILKVKLLPQDQVPPRLWKGANKRFKKVPWNRIAGRQLSQPKSEDAWEKQSLRVHARRKEKADKLKMLGYEYETPKHRSPRGLAQKAQPAQISQDDEVKAIETT